MTAIICIFFLACFAMVSTTLLYFNDKIRREEIDALEMKLWDSYSKNEYNGAEGLRGPKVIGDVIEVTRDHRLVVKNSGYEK